MINKLNQLSFVIGLFFILVAAILIIGFVMGGELGKPINLYSGMGMLIFGIFMVFIKENEDSNS